MQGENRTSSGKAKALFEFWWVFPAAILFSTVAISSGVSGALFFSPFFILVVGLSPAQAIGAGLLTEVFGMGNGLRSYVRQRLVDYGTARWTLLGAIPAVAIGAAVAHRIPGSTLKIIFGTGLVILAGFLILFPSPEASKPGPRYKSILCLKSPRRPRLNDSTMDAATDSGFLNRKINFASGYIFNISSITR